MESNSGQCLQKKCHRKVLFVVHSLNPGGTERLAINLALFLVTAKVWVEVVCLDEPGPWVNQLRSNGVPVHTIWRQPGLDLQAARRLALIAQKLEVEVIHAFQYTPWVYSALSLYFNSAPRLIFHEHGRFYPEKKKWIRGSINRFLLVPRTSTFLAVSGDIRSRLEKYEAIPSGRIEVIPNGIERPSVISDDEKHSLRSELNIPEHAIIVCSIGRIDSIKNYPLLIRSIAALSATHTDLICLIVGDGPELPEIKQLATTLNLTQQIRFVGHRDDATNIVQISDVFTLASFSEGLSVAILEAISLGKPCVVTNVGGNSELIHDGDNGFVVPSGDLSAFTGALDTLISDDGLRSEMSLRSIKRFRERYELKNMVNNLLNVYQKLWS